MTIRFRQSCAPYMVLWECRSYFQKMWRPLCSLFGRHDCFLFFKFTLASGVIARAGVEHRLMEATLRASSYEPGRPGWLGFRDLASPLFSLPKFRCVHIRRWAGPVTEISVFATEISVTELKNFPHMNTPARTPGLSGTKHFQLRMACKVANKSEHGSTGILGAIWTFFISVTEIKFSI